MRNKLVDSASNHELFDSDYEASSEISLKKKEQDSIWRYHYYG